MTQLMCPRCTRIPPCDLCGERPPTSVSDVAASGARATPGSVPLALQSAYAVYTLLHMLEGELEAEPPCSLGMFLADADEVQGCLALAAVVLRATCDSSPQLAKLRTIAGRLLKTHPAIGQELVEVLAGLDAELQGKA